MPEREPVKENEASKQRIKELLVPYLEHILDETKPEEDREFHAIRLELLNMLKKRNLFNEFSVAWYDESGNVGETDGLRVYDQIKGDLDFYKEELKIGVLETEIKERYENHVRQLEEAVCLMEQLPTFPKNL